MECGPHLRRDGEWKHFMTDLRSASPATELEFFNGLVAKLCRPGGHQTIRKWDQGAIYSLSVDLERAGSGRSYQHAAHFRSFIAGMLEFNPAGHYRADQVLRLPWPCFLNSRGARRCQQTVFSKRGEAASVRHEGRRPEGRGDQSLPCAHCCKTRVSPPSPEYIY